MSRKSSEYVGAGFGRRPIEFWVKNGVWDLRVMSRKVGERKEGVSKQRRGVEPLRSLKGPKVTSKISE